MPRIRIDLSYDGSHFKGWQIQSQGETTVQGELKKALKNIFKKDLTVIGASRTDTGVHALHQVVHFDVPKLPKSMNLKRALQRYLPPSVGVQNVYMTTKEFHANRSCTKKTYRYLIRNADHPSALRWQQSTWIKKPLDLKYLNEVSKILIGTHDFKCFQNRGNSPESTERTVFKAQWVSRKPGWVEFWITGDGFLKQMIRNIVGTLISMESHGKSPDYLRELIKFKDRRLASKTAEPDGLYLVQVFYPKELDNKCREI